MTVTEKYSPLSPTQQRLWLLNQLEQPSVTYNRCAAIQLQGNLHVPILQACFSEIIQRHAILRTIFPTKAGSPVTVICDAFAPLGDSIDLQTQPATTLQDLLIAKAQHPFDLSQGPLFCAFLIKLAPETHILQIVLHHIIADTASISILWGELATLYHHFSQGQPSPLPFPTQYVDYWQSLDDHLLETQRRYWQKKLANIPARLELPTDFPRPAVQQYQGASQTFWIAATLIERLNLLNQATTPLMTLLATFAVLLARYSGQDDIVIGHPLTTRTQSTSLIGCLANTLVLRMDLTAQPSFNTLLAQVRQTVLEAYQQQDIHLAQLIESLNPKRSLSYSPLFQVAFVFQEVAPIIPHFSDVTVTPVTVETNVTHFDLTLYVQVTEQDFSAYFEYNTDLFESTTIERLVQHFQTLLDALASNPDQPVNSLPLLTVAELEQFNRWNATQIPLTSECIHQLFETQVKSTPSAIAVIFEQQKLTYFALNQRANQLAHYLQTLEVKADTVVGICLERSLEMVIALLGVLKAGGAYLPLDPSYPIARLNFMLKDAQISVLLTEKKIGKILSANQCICLDSEWATLVEPHSVENLSNEVRAKQLAYVMYTSGSTGQPKGVGVPHQALVNHVQWMQATFPLTTEDRVLQRSPFSFDASVWEFYAPLIAGAGLVMTKQGDAHLAGTIAQYQVTILQVVPSLLHETLLQETASTLTTLKRIFCGGEMLTPALVEMCQAKLDVDIINLYGLTEACIDNTYWVCPRHACPLRVPIGYPIANTEIYILDTMQKQVPIGVAGELYIGGIGLARGYLNHPELTQERFIPHLFNPTVGKKLYRTGDSARFLATGEIEYLGRLDNQVKLRGFRVELGEVESIMSQHPLVRENVVIIHNSAPDNKQLVAYFVPNQPQSVEVLHTYLKQRLPDYMVPSLFISLEKLPLTPSGKIDRRTLSKRIITPNYQVLNTPEVEILAGIWKKLLQMVEINPYANFFDLGGHSLLVTQLLVAIQDTFGITIPLRLLFESPTLMEQSQILQCAQISEVPPPIQAKNNAPCASFIQQQFWLLNNLEGANSAYHLTSGVRLKGLLDREALTQSIQTIIDRHDSLRSYFPTTNGEPTIVPSLPFSLNIVEAKDTSAIEQQLQQEMTFVFDLQQYPLFRIKLIRCDIQEHILIIVLHQIIADSESIALFFNELSILYNALSDTQSPILPTLPIQYADFAVWQRNWLAGEPLAKYLAYWQQKLAGIPTLLELPTDYHRPAQRNYQGATCAFLLNPALTKQLKNLSQQADVTLFMTLLAGWATLLSRYSYQTDIAIGVPVTHRTHRSLNNLIGAFDNFLVLKLSPLEDITFSELLYQTRETTLEAYHHHQDLTFTQLLEALQPTRSPSFTPLFQVTLALKNAPDTQLTFTTLTAEPLTVETTTIPFDLSLTFEEKPEGLQGTLAYRTDLFDKTTIIRMVKHLQVLLNSVVANPQQSLAQIPLLTEAEKQQFQIWNATEQAYPQDQCIHQLFEAQVARTPEAIAITFEDNNLRYTILNQRANQLAHYLQALGVTTETLVGICVERALEMIVGLFGILKAGGAYVPLDPQYPAERIAFMLADAQVKVLVTQTQIPLPPHQAQVVRLDSDWPLIAQQPITEVTSTVTPDHLSYVIYTSGSTGKPKGVAITHRSVVAFTAWAKTVFTPVQLSGVLAATSICFDLSVFEIFVTLNLGGRVVLVSDALQLTELDESQSVTLINTVPSAMTELVRLQAIPKTVQVVNLAGEPLKRPLVDQLYQYDHIQGVYNLYGPSEDTTYSTFTLVPKDCSEQPTIGRPIANTQTYILDSHQNLVPIGVSGELYLGGLGLARGYLHRPTLTAERFVDYPAIAPTKLYKTGDLTRYRPDGQIVYLGRLDHQVKIRGFRIELGEIEAVLNQQVQESAVIVQGESQLIIAYFVPHQTTPHIEELKQHLRSCLPDYMIPATLTALEKLPLTPNGKIDRRALAEMTVTHDHTTQWEAPCTQTEISLAALWKKYLKVDKLSRHDHFFHLGGHSLLATQLLSSIRETFGIALPLRVLFESPTLAAQSQALQTTTITEAESLIPRQSREDLLPLSFAQQRLWFLDHLAGTAYNLIHTLHFKGPLNQTVLTQSLQTLIERHESLRTRFPAVDGEPRQVVDPTTTFTLHRLELQETATIQQFLQTEANHPFDLQQGPLVRVSLVHRPDQTHMLVLVIHHIIADGWSLDVFNRELAILYNALILEQSPVLPALSIQYADFAVWQRDQLSGDALTQHLTYWRQKLADTPDLLALPTDYPRPTQLSYRGATCPLTFDPALTASLKQLSQQAEATLFMTLLATFAVLLARYSGQEDIVIGTPIANRTHSQLNNLMGFFVNTLVLRLSLSNNAPFSQLLKQARQTALEAYQYQDLPFEQLVDVLQPTRSLSYTPLFQVMFVFQNTPDSPLVFDGLTVEPVPVDSTTTQFDLTLILEEKADSIQGGLEYNTDIFTAETIQRLSEHFQVLLEAIVSNPQQKIHTLPLLTQKDMQLLERWRQTAYIAPIEHCLHQLIETQVARTPEAIAVIFANQQLSYTALNKRANQLAHHLQTLGVIPNTIVGLCVERSLNMVVGILGILKAGGVYLPLDPTYPKARLMFMLTDAQPQVLVTQTSLTDYFTDVAISQVYLDSDTFAQQGTENPLSAVTPDNWAYIIYTSGSTGQPKGVLVTHRNIVHSTQARVYYYSESPTGFLLLSSFAFDSAMAGIFWTLTQGGQLILPQTQQDPTQLATLIVQHQVSHLLTIPSFYALLLTQTLDKKRLRAVIVAGETCPPTLVEQHYQHLPQVPLFNEYGPTEATVWCSVHRCDSQEIYTAIPIGKPIINTEIYILDAYQQLVPIGVRGEICVGGIGVTQGYLNRPELTAEKFIPHPYDPTARLYRTGDLGRYRMDGELEFLGRLDHQVKLRGFRIELGEIEAALLQHPIVQEAIITIHETPTDKKLVAYWVALVAYWVAEETVTSYPNAHALKHSLQLPDYMLPSVFIRLEALPLTANGKIDRQRLPAPTRSDLGGDYSEPTTAVEQYLAQVWQSALHLDQVGTHENFFDLGGNSLLIIKVHSELQTRFPTLSLVRLFQYPTIAQLASHLTQTETGVAETQPLETEQPAIAIIGFAGRFPQVKQLDDFWQNLCEGIEMISTFSEAELLATGVDKAVFTQDNYVNARAVLADIADFDAHFFDYSPKEAEIIDPQQRVLLECAWEALEQAGYDVSRLQVPVGVFAGVGANGYLQHHLYTNPDLVDNIGSYQLAIANDKDHLAPRISYKLNLQGPSVNVQTACSTSLVAVHLACQSLQRGECTMALAGGVSITVPQKVGYLYQEGMILSPDGHCRVFDAQAQGTVGGNGAGIVVLKCFDQALADKDTIYAIIRGSAINNDGSLKVGYTAPSVDGQVRVITQAMQNLDYASINYIEAHGTGTPLGDPIEITALKQAYQTHTDKKGFCAIGSLKSNIGHLDVAAGVAGLIKTVLALKHQKIPPSLHFTQPNPQIDFADSPFFVNTQLVDWQKMRHEPRRAGVSSFGIGGTNAHVVLEEAPDQASTPSTRPYQLLVFSAKTATALDKSAQQCAEILSKHDLADIAYTLSIGRKAFAYRQFSVCQPDAPFNPIGPAIHCRTNPNLCFLFSGQGTQYVNMGLDLYQHEPLFKDTVDQCATLLQPHLNQDIRTLLYLSAQVDLQQTSLAQPVLFTIEYALAQLWLSWGLVPSAMLGHSIGEYVSACLAGVFTLAEALQLVTIRGKLMQSVEPGAMLSVALPAVEMDTYLSADLSLAADNAPNLCVVSGTSQAIDTLAQQLTANHIPCQRLHTSHAFHSAMMETIIEAFTVQVAKISLHAPNMPYISNVTGTWITTEQATNPAYWATHLRQTVQFNQGLQTVLQSFQAVICLEIGPGRSLAMLVRQQGTDTIALTSLRHPKEMQNDYAFLLNTLGRLWSMGVTVDWTRFYQGESRQRVPLPTYPFERQRFWVDRPTAGRKSYSLSKHTEIANWFYIPGWKSSIHPTLLKEKENISGYWLIFLDNFNVGNQLVERLVQDNCAVITVSTGYTWATTGSYQYTLNPQYREDYDNLINLLHTEQKIPKRIIHLWSLSESQPLTKEIFDQAQSQGFYSILYLVQALCKSHIIEDIQLSVIANNTLAVANDESIQPEKATILSTVKVIEQEYPRIHCQCIDFSSLQFDVTLLLGELTRQIPDKIIAYRGTQRWIPSFEPVSLVTQAQNNPLKKGGIYLITGGIGKIGMLLAEYLAKTVQAKLVLVSRSARDIQSVQMLETLGSEVLILQADVADLTQMQQVIAKTEAHFGQIQGVIHAAGVIGAETSRTLAQIDEAHCQQQFQAKVYGTLVLAAVLANKPLDFCLLFSSLSSVLGGLGFTAYAAANLFLDAFVHQYNQMQTTCWSSINWDGWQFETENHIEDLVISPEEGVDAFQRILTHLQVKQWVISTGDLQTRLTQWVTPLHQPVPNTIRNLHPRPEVSTAYVAPRTEIEGKIADIWQTLLGIKQIGAFDDFFELGGHSLLATQVVSRLCTVFSVDVPIRLLFESPTIASLARQIERTLETLKLLQAPVDIAAEDVEEMEL